MRTQKNKYVQVRQTPLEQERSEIVCRIYASWYVSKIESWLEVNDMIYYDLAIAVVNEGL